MGSQKHQARVAHVRARGNGQLDDDSSSVQSSSLAREQLPQEDSEGEEDFKELVEGIKGASLTEGTKDSGKSTQQQGSTETPRKCTKFDNLFHYFRDTIYSHCATWNVSPAMSILQL